MLIKRSRIPIKNIITIGLLPSFLKCFYYKLRGYKIGKKVSLGFGTVIIGKSVKIDDFSTIGFLTIIKGKNIQIGSHVTIGSMSIIDTHDIKIGDGAKINEQVFIGGMDFPESKFDLGKNTIVMQLTYINTAQPVIIGDDSGIGGHCIIFTHGSWLNVLEGYPVQFAPVKIGKSVWLPWRVFVMPGCEIGDGSVIGANSLVTGQIPPRSLAAGSPAKIIKQAPDFPKELEDDEKIRIFEEIIDRMRDYFQFYGITSKRNDNIITFYLKKRKLISRYKPAKMYICFSNDVEFNSDITHLNLNLFISFYELDHTFKKFLEANKITWFDIARKERSSLSNDLSDEVALFLTRYGLRLDYSDNE